MQGVAVDGSHIYWRYGISGNTGIGRATLAGGSIEKEWIPPGSAGPSVVAGLRWIPATSIGRLQLDRPSCYRGGSIELNWITGISELGDIAINATSIYWTSETGKAIGRAAIAGTEVNQVFITGLPAEPRPIAVNASEHVYYGYESNEHIGRDSLTGGPIGSSITVAQAGNRLTPVSFQDSRSLPEPGYREDFGRIEDRPHGCDLVGELCRSQHSRTDDRAERIEQRVLDAQCAADELVRVQGAPEPLDEHV